MTAPATATHDAAGDIRHPTGVARAVIDGWTLTKRNLIGYTRIPENLFFSTVQPIVILLLFRYVFGGAIPVPGLDYVDYMMPGVFVMVLTFGGVATSVGLADDLHKGLIERFRSLPIARSAVLAGRTTADAIRNVFVLVLVTGVGYLVGFRIGTNVLAFLAGAAVLLLFAYALLWAFALAGLLAPDSETAQVMVFPVLFPMIFASSAFVPVESMPGWLQAFAANQPVTVTIDAARALMVGGPTTSLVLQAIAWSLTIIAVFAPIAIWQYRKRAL